jgi:hypothetical protein
MEDGRMYIHSSHVIQFSSHLLEFERKKKKGSDIYGLGFWSTLVGSVG